MKTTKCTGADLSSANLQSANMSHTDLSDANLSSAELVGANVSGATFVASYSINSGLFQYFGTNLTGADLAGLDLSGLDLSVATLTAANLTGSQLQNANMSSITELGTTFGGQLGQTNLTNANLTGANLSGATLTGAIFTGTLLVPSNQSVTATSQAGAVATWSTPPAIPGAMPGSCTPASGSTFPLFSSTVTCQVLDNNGDSATGTFQVNVAPTTQFFTRVLIPADGAVLAGAPYLDALAGDGPGVTNVVFELSGGTLSNQVIATATPTYYGWLAKWNTTTVPNGTYTLQSVATDADNNTDSSTPITVTVNNQPPTTAVLIPSNGATLSGTAATLDASASNATGVEFWLFGGSYGYSGHLVGTATPTYYGWLYSWNTTTVPSGSYALLSEAFGPGGSAFSTHVSITVTN